MRDAVTVFVTDLSVTHGAEELPHVVEQGAHHRLCVLPSSENVFKTLTFQRLFLLDLIKDFQNIFCSTLSSQFSSLTDN